MVASAVAIAGTVRAYRHRRQARTARRGWLLITADCLAMAYMFLLVDGGISLLTYALIAGFVLLSLGWAYGVFDTAHAPMCRAIPPLPGPFTPARVARAMQASMAASMAYMFVLMDPAVRGVLRQGLHHRDHRADLLGPRVPRARPPGWRSTRAWSVS